MPDPAGGLQWNRFVPYDRAPLNEIEQTGFLLGYEASWQAQFEVLKKFEEKNGHANVPKANDLYNLSCFSE